LLPLDIYRDIRDDLVDIYVATYFQYPPATEAFSKLTVSELQERAGKNAVAALNYEPAAAAAVGQIELIIGKILRVIAVMLVTIFLIGTTTGLTTLVALSREGLQFVTSISGILLTTVASGSTIVGVFAGSVFLYAWSLSASSTVVRVLNRELVYGPLNIKTRAHSRLVGYMLWNSSLDGSGAIKLLLIFSSLKVLSGIPGWDPYRLIKLKVEKNVDIFGKADGFIDGSKMLYQRLRSKRLNREQEAKEDSVINDQETRGR